MKISIETHQDQFNVLLSSREGAEPFITVKGCRIAQGSKGPFVSWPARKQDNGKWWSHVWGSDAFNAAVLAEAQKAAPSAPRAAKVELDDAPF